MRCIICRKSLSIPRPGWETFSWDSDLFFDLKDFCSGFPVFGTGLFLLTSLNLRRLISMLKIEFCEGGRGRGKDKSLSIQATLHESLLLPHDIEWVVWGNPLKQLLLQFLVMTPGCVAIMWGRRIVHLD